MRLRILIESKEWEYIPKKGLKFTRYGGLSPVSQKQFAVNKGLWCFIWPHFDWYFLSNEMSNDKFDKEGKPISNRYKNFYYDGPIMVHFNLPEKIPHVRIEDWNLVYPKDLILYLPKIFSLDLKYLRKTIHSFPTEDYGITKYLKYFNNNAEDIYSSYVKNTIKNNLDISQGKRKRYKYNDFKVLNFEDWKLRELERIKDSFKIKNPYRAGGFISKDHFEVFIPFPRHYYEKILNKSSKIIKGEK